MPHDGWQEEGWLGATYGERGRTAGIGEESADGSLEGEGELGLVHWRGRVARRRGMVGIREERGIGEPA